ncbi:hypothetical protein FQN60_005299, partial [Etheostoma spectabile]
GSQRQRPRVASHLALTLAPQLESRRLWRPTSVVRGQETLVQTPSGPAARGPSSRIPAAASQSGFPPGTDAGSSAGKPPTLEVSLTPALSGKSET